MAPPKVTKSPKKSAKSAEGSKLDKNLVFLWVCFENKAGQVDYDAVSQELGITTAAAKKRISRLKVLINKEGLLDKEALSHDMNMEVEESSAGEAIKEEPLMAEEGEL